jgi:hypothetical protein
MIIVRLLSPEPVGWIQHHQLYSGVGADIVMESITLTTTSRFTMSSMIEDPIFEPLKGYLAKVPGITHLSTGFSGRRVLVGEVCDRH